MKTDKGFTLVEVLVVVFVLFLLFFILNIIADHLKEQARWISCGSQLNYIGKATAMYQNEYRDLNPVVWSENVVNGSFGMGLYNKAGGTEITRWVNPNFSDWDNQPTVGGCLFLLIKYEDVDPKVFVCPKSPNDEIMELEDTIGIAAENGWVVEFWDDLNDFQSMTNLSYSCNDPWKALLDASAPASMVLMADKNNAYDTETGVRNSKASDFPVQNKNGSWDDDDGDNPRYGNSRNHGTEYQNVLFADTHVKRFYTPTAGVSKDNIYTYWSGGIESTQNQKSLGRWDKGHAVTKEDSYLGN
ncbi:MAG: prepilin-type N-terminal cleavage/methylation domain-containing protein [Sedimentisphaerales bacterium]|nr:prepilin-type N-terminal cleavage/methylation domain-containing protein [Sedimentisphaerales bacterium]